MVQQYAAIFGCLADPVRLGIVVQLASGEANIAELAKPHAMTLQAVRKHLAVLEAAQIVESRKAGRVRLCALRKEPLRQAFRWLSGRAGLWHGRLDALANLVEDRRL